MMENVKKYGPYLIPLLVACFVPLYAGKHMLNVMITAGILSIGTMGLNIIMGYAGQASLANGAFYGIGAYGIALLTSKAHLSFWFAVLLACTITAIIGFLIGLPALRTRGPYFAIVTLSFNYIVYIVVKNTTWLSGGVRGQSVVVPGYLDNRVYKYYIVFGFVLLTLFVMWRMSKSLHGLSLYGVRSNEDLADTLGVHTFREKMVALVVSCFIVGLAGCLGAAHTGIVTPQSALYLNSFYYLVYLLVGGIATLYGPLVGTVGIWLALEYMKDIPDYRYLILGIVLILVVIYFPRGIVGALKSLWEKLKGLMKRPSEESA